MANEKSTFKVDKKTKAELRESAKKQIMEESGLTEKDIAIFEAALKEAKMPVHLKDKDIKLGERELDIRDLSEKNLNQMMFRQSILSVVYLRQIAQSQVDLMRLLMLVLKQMGLDDIIKATDDLVSDLKEQVEPTASALKN